jgi:hypothetical protein
LDDESQHASESRIDEGTPSDEHEARLLRDGQAHSEEEAMKFFTPDLLARFGSDDVQVAHEAQEELERRAEEYLRSVGAIESILPLRFRELLDQLYLHDARIITREASIGTDLERIERSLRTDTPSDWGASPGRGHLFPSFWIPLRLDTPPQQMLLLQYRVVQIERAELHESLFEECPYLEWQYDEIDVARTGETPEFCHSILFTRGFELRVRFKDFDFATLKPMDAAEGLVRQAGFAPSASSR